MSEKMKQCGTVNRVIGTFENLTPLLAAAAAAWNKMVMMRQSAMATMNVVCGFIVVMAL